MQTISAHGFQTILVPYGHWLFNHFNVNPPDDVDFPAVSRDTKQLYDEIYNDVLMGI